MLKVSASTSTASPQTPAQQNDIKPSKVLSAIQTQNEMAFTHSPRVSDCTDLMRDAFQSENVDLELAKDDFEMVRHHESAEYQGFERLGFQCIPSQEENKQFGITLDRATDWLKSKPSGEVIVRATLMKACDAKKEFGQGILDSLLDKGLLVKQPSGSYAKPF